MLLPTEVDLISQEKSCKRNLVWPGGFTGSKMVFILLVKVVALYMGSSAVDIQGLGLELVSRSTFWRGLEECLNDFIQVLLTVAISAWILRRWRLKGSTRSLGKSLIKSFWGAGLFYLRVSLWWLFDLRDDGWIKTMEAWLLYARQTYPLTEVIFV